MNDSIENHENRTACPLCDHPIEDFSKIRPELARALGNTQTIATFLHYAKNKTYFAMTKLDFVMQNPRIRQNRQAVDALQYAIREMKELQNALNSSFRTIMYSGREGHPITEKDLREMHDSLDELFGFQCEIQFRGFRDRSLGLGTSEYRDFLRTVMELGHIAVGRLPRPHIQVRYDAGESLVMTEIRLREGAPVELDDLHKKIAAALGGHIGIEFESHIEGNDRVFRWRLPIDKS